MKNLMMIFLLLGSLTVSAADCMEKAIKVSSQSLELFGGQDEGFHCMASCMMTEARSLAVIQMMPVRSTYEMFYDCPCGPGPRSPKVSLTFDGQCRIHQMSMEGFDLVDIGE